MDPIFAFLWDRRGNARDLKKSIAWATLLLEQGFESDAILRLAGLREEDWHLERELVDQALRDIGKADWLHYESLCAAYEAELIADYYAEKISGEKLLDLASVLIGEADEDCSDFWSLLGEESSLYGGNGISPRFRFDVLPFDDALRFALTERGFPDPGTK